MFRALAEAKALHAWEDLGAEERQFGDIIDQAEGHAIDARVMKCFECRCHGVGTADHRVGPDPTQKPLLHLDELFHRYRLLVLAQIENVIDGRPVAHLVHDIVVELLRLLVRLAAHHMAAGVNAGALWTGRRPQCLQFRGKGVERHDIHEQAVGIPDGKVTPCRRRTGAQDHRVDAAIRLRIADDAGELEEAAVEVEWLVDGPDLLDDCEPFFGIEISIVVFEQVDTEHREFGRIAAGNDIQSEAPMTDRLDCHGLLGREHRIHEW